ncbi:uncharacterized protein LOC125769470 [Anopheles funestus]|uniref:uncharacterized protein LOC125762351 n=1 Tax=Anopheles funestus TaxID=62324 RepID=UPI0020C6FB35|nr:uncharacterized protein LOC125762351 [Anopheles funestus]XP_049294160.1 uncharacterized protein LOC125769470 [Anopheles funestus]
MDSRSEPKVKRKTVNMSEEETLVFIDLMFRHSALWNRQDERYKNLNRRQDDWAEISEQTGHPINRLKEKWTSLQSIYRKCRSAHNKSLITGSGAAEIYRPTWFAYRAMSFLDSSTACGTTIDTVSKIDILLKF